MSAIATAIVGGAVIGAVASNNASSKAAKAQTQAADSANQLQWDMYQQTRDDQAPWRDAGTAALGELQDGMQGDLGRSFTMADFQADPGYQFRLSEGEKSINRAAAAGGRYDSGAALKDLASYGQNMASQEYSNAYNRFNTNQSNRFNRLASLAGIGQTANNQVAAAGMNYGNNASNNLLAAGNARAAGMVGGANAVNGAMNSIGNYYTMSKLFGGNGGQSGGGGSSGFTDNSWGSNMGNGSGSANWESEPWA